MVDVHEQLHSPWGLFREQSVKRSYRDEPGVVVRSAMPGRSAQQADGSLAPIRLGGAGTGLTEGEAILPAFAEAMERRCATTFLQEQFLWSTQKELGPRAIDLGDFPRCSDSELNNSACPYVMPDPDSRIRWVKSLCLTSGAEILVPLLVTHITPPVVREERFLLPISTGCAAHTSYDRAMLRSILEVVERDALALTWLQRLDLPRLVFEDPEACFGELWQRYQSSSADLDFRFFDATTDLGIPTVYGLRVSRRDVRLHTIVACSSALDLATACKKVMLELSAFAIWLRQERSLPKHVDDYNQLHHGASFMAKKEQAHAFRFLSSRKAVSLKEAEARSSGLERETDASSLRSLLDRLTLHRLKVYAADLTTDEAIRAGLRVTRAVIPGLMPFSYVHRMRFLAHPRLYTAPRAMGHPVEPEAGLNPWPQPFG